jgi:hypothetical protein
MYDYSKSLKLLLFGVIGLMLIVMVIFSGVRIVDAFIGQGGFGSVKDISQQGVNNSLLTISGGTDGGVDCRYEFCRGNTSSD